MQITENQNVSQTGEFHFNNASTSTLYPYLKSSRALLSLQEKSISDSLVSLSPHKNQKLNKTKLTRKLSENFKFVDQTELNDILRLPKGIRHSCLVIPVFDKLGRVIAAMQVI